MLLLLAVGSSMVILGCAMTGFSLVLPTFVMIAVIVLLILFVQHFRLFKRMAVAGAHEQDGGDREEGGDKKLHISRAGQGMGLRPRN